jgi:hypothetical protein
VEILYSVLSHLLVADTVVVRMKQVLLVAQVAEAEAELMALLVKTLAMAPQVKVILVQVAFRSVEVAAVVVPALPVVVLMVE